ncbi:MAG: DUF3035 domain-containing protein [Paracoccaceae bacterium]
MRRIAPLLAALVLAGCDQIGDPLTALGARPPSPDEFKVIARAPLVVPPSARQGGAALPRPEPGQRSPLEPDPRGAARAALLGGGASGGTAGASRPAERALLAAAAEGAEADIRATLGADAEAQRRREEENYTPPTVFELFGFGDPDAPDPETLVDPVAESRRLQREGVPAPSDPESAAPDTAAAEAATAEREARTLAPRDRRIDGTVIRAPF